MSVFGRRRMMRSVRRTTCPLGGAAAATTDSTGAAAAATNSTGAAPYRSRGALLQSHDLLHATLVAAATERRGQEQADHAGRGAAVDDPRAERQHVRVVVL